MQQRVITFGEIMLRLATPGYQRFCQANSFEVTYGGSEANVAVSLAHLGIGSTFVTALPENDLAKSAMMNLMKFGVTPYIHFSGDRMGTYFLEKGASMRGSKVIYDRDGSSFAKLDPGNIDWEEIFDGASIFHWSGINPAVSSSAAEAALEAVKKANEKGLVITTDLNYRSKLWKWGKRPKEVLPSLLEYCDVIIGNEEAWSECLDISLSENVEDLSDDQISELTDQVFKRFEKTTKVVQTIRRTVSANHNTWEAALWNGEKLFRSPKYNIPEIVDRVGGGDSFVAGLIFGLCKNKGDQSSLSFATAASAIKLSVEGDFNLISESEIEGILKGGTSGRIVR
ncbi:sugar kinase [Fulvivirgaceae bacterium BMA10]|uniref:Sugar kinase n=1 Tax=Splendidivirga corallicola TaxID=3051826 RepID=A0ABT8KKQ4_9BACT|nr:sugar kinase [Fulvivirgaceae bacterium BMA10]